MNTKTSITTKTHSTSVDGVNARTEIVANITEINTRIVKLNGGVMRVKHKAPQRKEYKLQITQHLSDWGSNPLNDDYEYADIIVIGNDSCGARNVSEYAELYDRIVEHAIVGDMDYMILNYNRNGYKNVSEVIEDYLWVKPNKYQTGKVKKCFEKRYGEPDSHYYDEDLIDAVSRSNKKILDYFSETITIKSPNRQAPFRCMYPFIGTIIEKLIEQKNAYADTILSRCIAHNKNIYEKVKELRAIQYGEGKNAYSMFRLCFYTDNNVIEAFEMKQHVFIVANLIRMNTYLDSDLIKRLNSYCDKILDIAREEGDYVF